MREKGGSIDGHHGTREGLRGKPAEPEKKRASNSIRRDRGTARRQIHPARPTAKRPHLGTRNCRLHLVDLAIEIFGIAILEIVVVNRVFATPPSAYSTG